VAEGGSDFLEVLGQLESPDSTLSRQWEQEHDAHVLAQLLARLEAEFEPTTLRAFRRLAIDGQSGEAVTRELGLSPGAVYVARSRVMRRLREEAAGLLD
jgi:RNA polymerase sigma-70 factor (ECF subfamily)